MAKVRLSAAHASAAHHKRFRRTLPVLLTNPLIKKLALGHVRRSSFHHGKVNSVRVRGLVLGGLDLVAHADGGYLCHCVAYTSEPLRLARQLDPTWSAKAGFGQEAIAA